MKGNIIKYIVLLLVISLCTAISLSARKYLTEGDVAMIYLLGVVAVSSRFSWIHSIIAVFFSVALTNFLFVPPLYTFHVENIRSLITFLVMFIVGTLVTWLSMSLRKQNEEIRKKEHEKAQIIKQNDETNLKSEKEKLRNDLLSSIAHDLRTPLSSISGTAAVLSEKMDELDNLKKNEMLHTISDETFRLSRLLENILNITKLESSGFKVKREWYPLEEIIVSAISRFEKIRSDRIVRISLPDEMIMVHVDPVLIEQVIINLLENAAKYSFEKTEINIEAGTEDSFIFVCVIDKGPGVKTEDLDIIFEKFQQLQRGSDMKTGSGIGLSVCKAIIKVHNGEIFAQNTSGNGFKVSFKLPAMDIFTPEKTE